MNSLLHQVTPEVALHQKVHRCVRALRTVASVWSILAISLATAPTLFGVPVHYATRLRPLAAGAFMVTMGIYSVLIPVQHIFRDVPAPMG